MQRVGKKLSLAGLDDDPAIMPPDKPRDFAFGAATAMIGRPAAAIP